MRGPYKSDKEPFFVFRDQNPVKPDNFRWILRRALTQSGFDSSLYCTHSLHIGRTCDLFKLGLSVETIKKIGQWRSNAVFKYLCD